MPKSTTITMAVQESTRGRKLVASVTGHNGLERYATVIPAPYGKPQLSYALRRLADMLYFTPTEE